MRISRNQLLNAFLLTLMATAVVAFFGGNDLGYAQQPRVLSVMLQDFHEAESQKAVKEVIIPGFEALHPGVKVEVSWIPWDEYVEHYVTLYLGGVLPDVVSIGSAGLGLFLQNGIIRDIDSYMKGWDGLKDTVPAALEDVEMNGKLYAVPYRLDVRTLTYNMNFFDQAGLNRNLPPKTWDDLTSYAKKLTKYDADGAITVQGYDVRDDIYHVIPFIFQAGGNYISADGKQALIAQKESIEAISFLNSLIFEHKVALRAGGNIFSGKVAMQHNSTWLMRPQYQTGYEIGVAEPTRQREQATQVHVNKFAISSTSKQPDLAWEWIKYFMERENLRLVGQASQSIPGRISVLFMRPYTDDARWGNWLKAAMVTRPIPGHIIELPKINSRVNTALRDIFNGKQSVRTALEQAADEINKLYLNQS